MPGPLRPPTGPCRGTGKATSSWDSTAWRLAHSSNATPGSPCCCICRAWMPTAGSVPTKLPPWAPALAGHGAEAVRDAIASTITILPEQLRESLTWDQGSEMAQHAQLRIDTGLQIYFCDPHSPWQQPVAARNERKQQRPSAAILSQGHRPDQAQRHRSRHRCRCPQQSPPKDPRLEDPSRSAQRSTSLNPNNRC